MHQKIQNELLGIKKEIKEFEAIRDKFNKQRLQQTYKKREERAIAFINKQIKQIVDLMKKSNVTPSLDNSSSSIMGEINILKEFLMGQLTSDANSSLTEGQIQRFIYSAIQQTKRSFDIKNQEEQYLKKVVARIAYPSSQNSDFLSIPYLKALSNCLKMNGEMFDVFQQPDKFHTQSRFAVFLTNTQGPGDMHATILFHGRQQGLYPCCSNSSSYLHQQPLKQFYYDLFYALWLIIKQGKLPSFQQDYSAEFDRRLPAIKKYCSNQNYYMLYWILKADWVDMGKYLGN